MVQGTGSWAGKSIIATALCRVALNDGIRVAPFKAQNMSLNSFVTRDGAEIGRSQAVQAQACRVEPDARMNPVLIKPGGQHGTQLVVMGKPYTTQPGWQYVNVTEEVFEVVKRAYDSLASEFELIVLEGAGSPAEVNLKERDIANMRIARYAEAAVLLVGDIDRGGVFASFVGTMEILEKWERELVAGFIINRFRGEESLLQPALDFLERRTGRAVFGIIPFIENLALPEEDAVSIKLGLIGKEPERKDCVEIVLIDLPHISNFTDFDALCTEPDVRLRVVRSAGEMGVPDAVIIPGSKNVIADIEALRREGIANALQELAGKCEIIGLCGGFQMLGTRIDDPYRVESEADSVEGLGLLDLETVLEPQKTLVRAEALHIGSGLPLRGYEIHHGRTECGARCCPMIKRSDGEVIGVSSEDGLLWGSYLHGLFDADEFRRWFIDRLRRRRGLAPLGRVSTFEIESSIEELAEVVRECLPVEELYRLCGLR